MRYYHSLTAAVQMEIDRHVERQIAKADDQLDRQQTAEELRQFLTDETKLATPGFVLRRYIQTQGKLKLIEPCADLSRSGNVPWPEKVVKQAAEDLHDIGKKRHGLEISPALWEQYLTADMPQGPHRKTFFQIAIVTGMDREATTDLLLACGQPSYNMRSPIELICWFCQILPGLYTWRDIERLLKQYQERSAKAEKGACEKPERKEPTGNTTRLLSWSVDEILGSGDPPVDAERELIELMVENRGGMRGYSRTARKKYLRLLDYLNTLHPANPHKLTSTMYRSQGWNFRDVHQTTRGEERSVFRGEAADEGTKRAVTHLFYPEMGKIALFCKWYNSRISAIRMSTDQGGSKNLKEWKDVHRWDILLLGYFLITGYMDAPAEIRAALREMTKEGGPIDRRMVLLWDDLNALRPDSDMKEKQVLCCRVLNELLAGFGFFSLYPPAPFDRFILLCLLTDSPAWMSRYLLGENL